MYPLFDAHLAHDSLKSRDKWAYKWHFLKSVYPSFFDKFKDKQFNFLEIGVDKGGSLRAWKDYFPQARIVGIDINPECTFEEDRIHVAIGDQNDIDFLHKVNEEFGPFSIIIDDGGHIGSCQVNSFKCLFPELLPAGIYAVEDLEVGESVGFTKYISNASYNFSIGYKTYDSVVVLPSIKSINFFKYILVLEKE